MNIRADIREMTAAAGSAHRRAGEVFLVALLVLAGIGAAVAPFLADLLTAGAGLMIAWLALTAWATMRQGQGSGATTTFAGGAV
jgi:hypothetical protein